MGDNNMDGLTAIVSMLIFMVVIGSLGTVWYFVGSAIDRYWSKHPLTVEERARMEMRAYKLQHQYDAKPKRKAYVPEVPKVVIRPVAPPHVVLGMLGGTGTGSAARSKR